MQAELTVKALLGDLMKSAGITRQEEFAATVGIDQSTVSDLLNDKYALGRRTCARLIARFPEREPDITRVYLSQVGATL